MWPSYGTYESRAKKGAFAGTLGVMADESPATKQDIQDLKVLVKQDVQDLKAALEKTETRLLTEFWK
jgi:hypothetical protein